jgi:hypothetical protein
MTISVPVDLLRREFRLFIARPCSLCPSLRTSLFSNAPFTQELVAQTLNTDIRFDPLHPRQSEGIGWMEWMHLFVICPCSGSIRAFLRIRIPPTKVSARARLTRVATDGFGREFHASGLSRILSRAKVPQAK